MRFGMMAPPFTGSLTGGDYSDAQAINELGQVVGGGEFISFGLVLHAYVGDGHSISTILDPLTDFPVLARSSAAQI